jgi:hypothetical protein
MSVTSVMPLLTLPPNRRPEVFYYGGGGLNFCPYTSTLPFSSCFKKENAKNPNPSTSLSEAYICTKYYIKSEMAPRNILSWVTFTNRICAHHIVKCFSAFFWLIQHKRCTISDFSRIVNWENFAELFSIQRCLFWVFEVSVKGWKFFS